MDTAHRRLLVAAMWLLSLSLHTANGCLTKQEPRPQSADTPDTPTTTPLPNHLQLENCTSGDKYYNYCSDHGRCEVLINVNNDDRSSSCRCDTGFTGEYCYRKARPPPTISMGSVVAAAVAGGILLLVLVVVGVYVCWVRKRRQDSETLPDTENLKRREGDTTPGQFSQYSTPSANASPTQNGGHENIELLHVQQSDERID